MKLELQWRKAPPCSSWDTGIVAPLIVFSGDKSLNYDVGNHNKKVGNLIGCSFPLVVKV